MGDLNMKLTWWIAALIGLAIATFIWPPTAAAKHNLPGPVNSGDVGDAIATFNRINSGSYIVKQPSQVKKNKRKMNKKCKTRNAR